MEIRLCLHSILDIFVDSIIYIGSDSPILRMDSRIEIFKPSLIVRRSILIVVEPFLWSFPL